MSFVLTTSLVVVVILAFLWAYRRSAKNTAPRRGPSRFKTGQTPEEEAERRRQLPLHGEKLDKYRTYLREHSDVIADVLADYAAAKNFDNDCGVYFISNGLECIWWLG